MNISIYKDTFDTVGKHVKLTIVLDGIKSGRWKDKVEALRAQEDTDKQSEIKQSLPAACFSGTFVVRDDKQLMAHSGFICLDIDHVEPIATKIIVKDDPYIYALFTSPRGHGVKILCAVGSCNAGEHKLAFNALKKHFYDKYAIEADRSGCNVSRLCYVSYDPDMVKNDNYSVFTGREGTTETEKQENNTFQSVRHVGKEKATDQFTISKCLQWVEKYYRYQEGERNNYIHHFACLLNRVGLEQEVARKYLTVNFDLGEKEINTCVNSAYSKNKHEHGKIHVNDIQRQVPGGTVDPEKQRFKMVLMEDMTAAMFSKIKDAIYVTTTVKSIDALTGGGLMLGNFYGIIGREGTMKSILSQAIAIENAKKGIATIYFNGEMSDAQFFKRAIKKELGIDISRQVEEGKMTESDVPALHASLSGILKGNLYVVNGSGYDTNDIHAFIKNISLSTGKEVSLVVVDGISSMADPQDSEIWSAIQNSFNLKELAKETNAAIIALAHTKSGVDKNIRDMAEYVRGGIKMTANMDGYFSTSLLIDPSQSSLDDENPIWREGMFYLRYNDKRDSGKVINTIMEIKNPLTLEATGFNPDEF